MRCQSTYEVEVIEAGPDNIENSELHIRVPFSFLIDLRLHSFEI